MGIKYVRHFVSAAYFVLNKLCYLYKLPLKIKRLF